jgi:hypothetical protein
MDTMIKPKELSDDMFARERRLRRMARKQGLALVRPMFAEKRRVGSLQACYVLVPHDSGLSLDEVEAILTRDRQRSH